MTRARMHAFHVPTPTGSHRLTRINTLDGQRPLPLHNTGFAIRDRKAVAARTAVEPGRSVEI
jgi:hypothetical protein